MRLSRFAGASAMSLLLAACGGASAPASLPPASSAPASAAVAKSAVSAPASPAVSKPAAAASSPAAAAKPGTTKVRYGLPTAAPDLTTVGIYWGIDNGYFADAGLDVSVTPYPGSTTSVRALLSRDADVVMTGTNVFDAQSSGAPVKIISSPVDKPTDVWAGNKNVPSLKDLGGKSFAISTPNSPAHIETKILAQRNGVDPNSIKFVGVGSPADRIRALLGGKVDATDVTALGQKPLLDAIDAGQVTVLATGAKEFPEVPLAYDIATDDTVKNQSAMLAAFVKAEIKGYRWAQQNPEQAAAIAAKHIPSADPAVMTRSMKDMASLNVLGIDGGISLAGVDKTVQTLVEQKAISKPVKAADITDTSFANQAVKSLS